MLVHEFALALVVLGAADESPPAAALLPADTAIVAWCDDIVALRASFDALPLHALLHSGDHDEFAAALSDAWALFVRGALPGIDVQALAAAPIARAFVALAPNDRGDFESVIGLEWLEAEPDGIVTVPQLEESALLGLRKRTLGRWTIVTRSKALDDRVEAVSKRFEPALAARAKYVESAQRPQPGSKAALRVWADPDILQHSMIGLLPFIDAGRPDLTRAKTLGAIAWSARVDHGRVASEMFLEAGAAPSWLHVDDAEAFSEQWLALVPQDARAFVFTQLPFADVLHEEARLSAAQADGSSEAAAVEPSDATTELKTSLDAFASVVGSRVLIVVPAGGMGVVPSVHAYVEVLEPVEAARSFNAVMDSLAAVLVDDVTLSRDVRPDGRVVYELTPNDPLPFPVSIALTVDGAWLVASTQRHGLDAALRRTHGQQATDVRSNPRFAELFATLTDGQSEFHGVSFVDPRAAIADGTRVIAMVAAALAGSIQHKPLELAVGDSLIASIEAAPASVAITRFVDGGWMTQRVGFLFGDLSLAWCALDPDAAYLLPYVAAESNRMLGGGRAVRARIDMRMIRASIDRYAWINSPLKKCDFALRGRSLHSASRRSPLDASDLRPSS